ncbi:hypothetical protein N7539_006900 [Penicillium diatomitis]|uniref:Uncharacterized protein n=1 Tax=Penicillium diatomitis TaxID=2819901 RepID=A0A9W9X3A1_9EURO|nr:uncharacterized protein N7539_006900 [Penicillium diatomitis]KAJ5481006.1 hypothetical protein N7539_006900 [Penicillium diatomitis]
MSDPQVQPEPRRRRKPSISERFQRVLHGDRAEKRRQSYSPGDDAQGLESNHQSAPSATTAQALTQPELQPKRGELPSQRDSSAHTNFGVSDTLLGDSYSSTQTYSPRTSQLPSVSTPQSSLSVPAASLQDEQTSTPRPVSITDNCLPREQEHEKATEKAKEKEEICSSPTWKKTSRKERRATKRLEAERKELEKRLRKLEESQAKHEKKEQERKSRRLTKKQPIQSGKRSTSTESDRPRSSRSFTSFFSSSRRSSRSRANSENGHQSTDDEGAGPRGPPTLPLALPERFGTAVSRELASRHGTSLMTSHQLSRSSHLLHHSATKSDDLRENWRMAEAWQRQNHDFASEELASARPRSAIEQSALRNRAVPKYMSQPSSNIGLSTNVWAELDRMRFTATLRQDIKPEEPSPRDIPSSLRPALPVNTQSSSSLQSTGARGNPGNSTRMIYNSGHGQAKGGSQTKVYSYIPLGQDGKHSKPMMQKHDSEGSLQPQQKGYKSSPLAMNPLTTGHEEDGKAEEMRKSLKASIGQKQSYELIPQPLRISSEGSRSHNRQVSSPAFTAWRGDQSPSRSRADRQTTLAISAPSTGLAEVSSGVISGQRQDHISHLQDVNKRRPASAQSTPPSPIQVPLKHPGRKYALAENSPYGRLSLDSKVSAMTAPEEVPAATHSEQAVSHAGHSLAETSASKSTPNVLGNHRFSRASSEGSSYDTADEQVLDVSMSPVSQGDHQLISAAKAESAEVICNLNHDDIDSNAFALPNSSTTEQIGRRTKLRSKDISLQDPSLRSTSPSPPHPSNPTVHLLPPPPPPLSRNGFITKLRRTSLSQSNQSHPTIYIKDQLVAKLFVICCGCNHWHDLPAELYAQLTCPERFHIVEHPEPRSQTQSQSQAQTYSRPAPSLPHSPSQHNVSNRRTLVKTPNTRKHPTLAFTPAPNDTTSNPKDKPDSKGQSKTTENNKNIHTHTNKTPSHSPVFGALTCPWCGHELKTSCCQGWTTVVQMQHKHH